MAAVIGGVIVSPVLITLVDTGLTEAPLIRVRNQEGHVDGRGSLITVGIF
jgi:hypothetical protein